MPLWTDYSSPMAIQLSHPSVERGTVLVIIFLRERFASCDWGTQTAVHKALWFWRNTALFASCPGVGIGPIRAEGQGTRQPPLTFCKWDIFVTESSALGSVEQDGHAAFALSDSSLCCCCWSLCTHTSFKIYESHETFVYQLSTHKSGKLQVSDHKAIS